MEDKKIVKMVMAAVIAAITCVVTMNVKMPSFGPGGYANIGDSMVILSAYLLGGWYGALAAGIGSGLADLLGGYGYFVPGTTIIKFTMSIVAYLVYKFLANKKEESFNKKIFAVVVSAISAEIVMLVGYFGYEVIFLSYGAGAFGALTSNAIQAVTNIALSVVVVIALDKAHAFTYIKRVIGKTA